jgi:uncharacterized protein DUF5317
MLGLLALALIGIPLAFAAGGTLRSWTRVRIHWAPLLLAAFAAELILYNAPVDRQPWALTWGPLVWMGSKVAMLAVFLRNARERRNAWISPWLIAAIGIALNTVVIGFNGGFMPQSLAAREAVWGNAGGELWDQPGRLYNIAPMTDDTRLPLLADILPEPRWFVRPNVVSVGDLLLALGVCAWVFECTLIERRRQPLAKAVSA